MIASKNNPWVSFARELGPRTVLLALAACIFSVPGFATTTSDQALWDHQYNLLRQYKLTYAEEIFDYCLDEFGPWSSGLGSCLSKNDELKRRVLKDAREQLGEHSLALGIYDQCLDRHPMVGVKPVGLCVDTRLYLRDKLDDDFEERRIYLKCDQKWRKHGYSAIDNCARREVGYFRRWKKYREE